MEILVKRFGSRSCYPQIARQIFPRKLRFT
jgi:hypothetical protein